MKESLLMAQQIEASDSTSIHHLNEEIEALETSLQMKEATAAHLLVDSTPGQFLESLPLMTETYELECRLQIAKCQKQQEESKREAAVQEVKAWKEFEAQLHAQLGKQ